MVDPTLGGYRDFRAEWALSAATGTTAMDRAAALCGMSGRRAAIVLAKNAARRYRRFPAYLDTIAAGLSNAHPAFVLAQVDREMRRLRGGRDLIVPVMPVNLRGAAIYARWERRFGERPSTMVAAE